MLLNVGPDKNGVIPPSHVAVLKEVGAWMEQFGASIYGTRPGPFQPVDDVYGSTQKDHCIYIHLFNPAKNARVVLPTFDQKIKAFSLLSAGSLEGIQTESGIELAITDAVDDGFPAVIELVLED